MSNAIGRHGKEGKYGFLTKVKSHLVCHRELTGAVRHIFFSSTRQAIGSEIGPGHRRQTWHSLVSRPFRCACSRNACSSYHRASRHELKRTMPSPTAARHSSVMTRPLTHTHAPCNHGTSKRRGGREGAVACGELTTTSDASVSCHVHGWPWPQPGN